MALTTVDLAAMDKECSALGGLFQQVVTDMKVGRFELGKKDVLDLEENCSFSY